MREKIIKKGFNNMLSKITPILQKLSKGENLSLKEAAKAFNIIGDYDNEGSFFTAFSMGLMAKGPTREEILGLCQDRKERIGTLEINKEPSEIIDFSGGGGDKIKTINVSTAASLVAAAGGLSVAKQAAAALTGVLGSSDILQKLGIEVVTDKREKEKIKKSLETTNFTAYNYAALAPARFINYLRWRKKVVEIGLKFFIPWHIASFAYSPIKMDNRIYGLANPKYLELLAEVLKELGYSKFLVVCGLDGLDEISNIGKTKVTEVRNDVIKEYELVPADFGIKTAKIKEIIVNNREESIKNFLKTIMGKGTKANHDLVAINAGAAFYLTGIKKTLKHGADYASKLMVSGKVADKLEEIVCFNKGEKKLFSLIKNLNC